MSGALSVIKQAYVNARAALFDLRGDHVCTRWERASTTAPAPSPAASDITPPAVDTAISRAGR
ncbi:hypothetical protein Sme01_12980 [Sphaerisporangium melleum]|uniref:Uncharacterized protein n=1 Tax=Sphaerisporangium melleum TaxID=321316 RepID=A0A917RID5_9ACTN|nr:hypothetical protein GCM10007964_58450 [Sphaerisporangium melleum]GII68822.1 hypothetical protein Sme01_12980 [Sphaerisporangium melleum]